MVGGVDKSTSTAPLGAALAQAGQKVAVVDSMSACANLDLRIGASRRAVFDLRRPERREAFASPHPRQTARTAT
jgi:septum formation inhibitor-activating ATPase MinD